MERTGEVLTTTCALIFQNFNFHEWSDWCWWLIAAFAFMGMYELWWIRYFRSERKLSDFYSSFAGIPLAGASLPVIAFFLLSIYGKVACLTIAVIFLGIGHITPAVKYRRFYLLKFPSAALCPIKRGRPSSIVVALATTHSSALQMKIYSA